MEKKILWLVVLVLVGLRVADFSRDSSRGKAPPTLQQPQDERLAALEERFDRLDEHQLASPRQGTDGREPIAPSEANETLGAILDRLATLEQRMEAEPTRPSGEVRRLNDAIARGDLETIGQLLRLGIDLNARDEDRNTALGAASAAGNSAAIEVLLEAGADLERKSGRRDMTPLLVALDSKQEDAALLLLDRGADLEAADKNGENGLIWASFNGLQQVVAKALASRVKVDFQAHDGASALVDAARRGHLEIVRTLLAHGADVNLRDRGGRTALGHAVDQGHEEVVRLLQQHGGVR